MSAAEKAYRKLLLSRGVAIEMPSLESMEGFCAAASKHASPSLRNALTFGQFTGGARHALILPPADELLAEFGAAAEKVGRKGAVIRGDVVVAPKRRVGVVRETFTSKGKRRAWVVFRYGDSEYTSGYEQGNDEAKLLIVAKADRDERDRDKRELVAGWSSAMSAYDEAIAEAEELAPDDEVVIAKARARRMDERLGSLYDAAYAEKAKLIEKIGYNDVSELKESEEFIALQRRAGAVVGRLRSAKR